MRQIHAAIEHLDRGDFECAITLAAAGEEMLPPTDDLHFRKLQGVKRVDDIVSWLINESEVIIVIYRAIAKFDAVFGDQKTPQMISFRIYAGPRLQDVGG
jgi:hypothetical protein